MRVVMPTVFRVTAAVAAAASVALGARSQTAGQDPPQAPPQVRFKSRVDLVNVTATVVDESGRFVRGLEKDDFALFEDDKPQPISLFFNERVPVSLGVALDTSGSMQGEKYGVARDALDRFLGELLDPSDEIFLYRFDDDVQLLQGWTTNRTLLRRALGRVSPRGATALYDAVADAVPLAGTGKHRKKALVLITDGNDTTSHTTVAELKRVIRDSEVLVYAIGIDSRAEPTTRVGRLAARTPRSRPRSRDVGAAFRIRRAAVRFHRRRRRRRPDRPRALPFPMRA